MLKNKLIQHCALLLTLFTGVSNIAHTQGLPPLTHNLTTVNPAFLAPELRFKDLDDDVIDIKNLKGKVIVVNFWATWCPPCRREMGSLERLYQATKEQNVEVLAVNIGEDIDTVFSFLGTIDPSPNFKILFDTNGDSMKKWGVKGLPTTYIVTPDGTIAYRAVGGREFDHPDLQKTIIKLLK